LLNWQVVPPPQSPEQLAQVPSRQSPSAQLLAAVQLAGLGAGTQLPRKSQTRLEPNFRQSLFPLQRPLLMQEPLLQ
jgi:hypothetical protein